MHVVLLECDDDGGRAKAAGSRRAQCSMVYADGTCDHDCDSAACLWDGGDCIGTALRYRFRYIMQWLQLRFDARSTAVRLRPLRSQ